jgi:predicted transcriptional regulator
MARYQSSVAHRDLMCCNLDRRTWRGDSNLRPGQPSYFGLDLFEKRSGLNWFECESLREQIPTIHQDLLIMFFEKGKRQKDLAKIFGFTKQSGVSHAIAAAIRRVQWLARNPDPAAGLMVPCEGLHDQSYNHCSLIINMIREGVVSQTVMAKRLGINQSQVRALLQAIGCKWKKKDFYIKRYVPYFTSHLKRRNK